MEANILHRVTFHEPIRDYNLTIEHLLGDIAKNIILYFRLLRHQKSFGHSF